jgi:chemotaxis response regulator CheB
MSEPVEAKPSTNQPNTILRQPHPDDVKMALEMAKYADETPFEFALRRMVANPDPFIVKAALASCEGLGEEYRLSILAQTYENLATEYEKASGIKEGIEARQMAEKLREETRRLIREKTRRLNQNKPQENQ